MRPRSWLRASIVKEVRALLPVWLGSVAVTVAGAVAGRATFAGDLGSHAATGSLYAAGLIACCLGAAGLGALSVGHEYLHGTLAVLLGQPVGRRRIFLVKLGVLAALLLSLGGIAWIANGVHPGSLAVAPQSWRVPTVIGITVLSALFVAPLITMLCRNPLAGVVFTAAVPAAAYVFSQFLAVARYGQLTAIQPAMEGFTIAVLWRSMLLVWLVTGVLGWWAFMRLQVIEGRRDVEVLGWLRRLTAERASATDVMRPARRRQPLWLLAKKELRLQEMPFLIAGLYVVAWAAMVWLGPRVPDNFMPVLGVMRPLYSALTALLIGSLACAEERQLGMLPSQQLLPVAAWKPWAIKVGAALGVSLVLALGLPALLASIHSSPADMPITESDVRFVILLTTGGLYISSLSSGGLQAFLLCFPVAFVGVLLLVPVLSALSPLNFWVMMTMLRRLNAGHVGMMESLPVWLLTAVLVCILAGLVGLVLKLAQRNQRSAERSLRQVGEHVLWIAAGVMVALVLSGPLLEVRHVNAVGRSHRAAPAADVTPGNQPRALRARPAQ